MDPRNPMTLDGWLYTNFFDTRPDGTYRMARERPRWFMALIHGIEWFYRLRSATRHAYHEFRGWMGHDYDARRNVRNRARPRRLPPRELPAEVWIRVVDCSAECERDPRLRGQEYWAETSLWGGGVSSSDPLTAIQATVEMALRMIARGDDTLPGGKLTITLDANPLPPEQQTTEPESSR